jgi:hypothetical protein
MKQFGVTSAEYGGGKRAHYAAYDQPDRHGQRGRYQYRSRRTRPSRFSRWQCTVRCLSIHATSGSMACTIDGQSGRLRRRGNWLVFRLRVVQIKTQSTKNSWRMNRAKHHLKSSALYRSQVWALRITFHPKSLGDGHDLAHLERFRVLT